MQNAEKQPHGVGGWLAVLVYWLIVIGPALGLLMLFGTISSQLQDSSLSPQVGSSQLLYLTVLDGVTWITQSGLSIYAGRRLRDPFRTRIRSLRDPDPMVQQHWSGVPSILGTGASPFE